MATFFVVPEPSSLEVVNTPLLKQIHSHKESLEDSQVPGVCATEEVIRYEYHVLYSSSYQVPVLYFRACCLDGRPLTLDEIWKSVHACYQARLLERPWDTITQQEHPLLGQPFFVLHPCQTNEFMSSILTSSQKDNRHTNYIVLWLSTVGPVVGLNLPLSYAKLALEQNTNADSDDRFHDSLKNPCTTRKLSLHHLRDCCNCHFLKINFNVRPERSLLLCLKREWVYGALP
ncbi:ubiquitin-like-conjugating enzyme ATG10 [Dryobates pubescens]|uniref:ubiquitin-like-conjugating enzyme ATG10 n=1 Tax=Dryobates pubescens TaxID=118200 RepID=UPI0023B9C7F0|nr:ubiquitin-like-conjugating enzyme ATG10 [Dryobates pubescens]